jgi:DNA-binding transcriptional regulator YbjK
MKYGSFVIRYFSELNDLISEIFEAVTDEEFDLAKNKINKLIYQLQELRKLLHDNNE